MSLHPTLARLRTLYLCVPGLETENEFVQAEVAKAMETATALWIEAGCPIEKDPEAPAWGRVDVMGHDHVYGLITKTRAYGISLVRVVEPEEVVQVGDQATSHTIPRRVTEYGANAIFSISYQDETTTRWASICDRSGIGSWRRGTQRDDGTWHGDGDKEVNFDDDGEE